LLNDEPLKKKIQEFGKFPIGTGFDKGQPRLLVTAVDIAEGITVTFDSYKKSDGKRKTVYYPRGKYGHKPKPIVIEYDEGITIEHVMASGTLPEYYDPKEICNNPKDEICKRKFWDGGLLNNTPLKELLEAHRDYWVNVENKDEAPDLEVYIVNVHPSTISVKDIPKHYDEVKDRRDDIIMEIEHIMISIAASVATDYIDFINSLNDIAIKYIKEDKDKTAFQKKFESLKAELAKCTSYAVGEHIKYQDLIRGSFELTKVERIERKYNPETSTSFKAGDITPQTIEKLIEEGEGDEEFASIS
jgi:predicted acylesterase/phospholipase RssA